MRGGSRGGGGRPCVNGIILCARGFHTCDCVDYCMNDFVHRIHYTIAGVNAPTWYNTTHTYSNSSSPINRMCESSFKLCSDPAKVNGKAIFEVFRLFFIYLPLITSRQY